MNSERIKELLQKIPISAIVGVFVLWIGWDYYSFTAGELQAKREALENAERAREATDKKLTAAKEFMSRLESKRAELRSMAQQLEQMKARLSDQLDVPAFIKLVSNEAARVGLRVVGIKPGEPKPHSESFYTEHPFDLEFRSVYPQLLIYLNRLATMETIVRVDKFSVGSAGSPTAQFVELSGKIELKTYKYLLSTADEKANELGKSAAATPPGGAQPVAKPASGEVRSGR